MALQESELKWYKAIQQNDTNSNGGYLSATQSNSNVKNNIFPDVRSAERTAGSTKYRKLFLKAAAADDSPAQAAKLFVENFTQGDDRVVIFPGTQSDTQNTLTGSERVYGCGSLNANTIVGATSCAVQTESTTPIFVNGDTIRISSQTDISDETGSVEYRTLTGVSYTGSVATLTFAAQPLDSAYSTTNTRVASVIAAGDIEATISNFVKTSVAGTFDTATYPVDPDAIGSIEDSWVLTFTSATQFSIVGTRAGNVGTGTTGTATIPLNPDNGQPYFSITNQSFGGTWATGNTITFQTHPAAYPLWFKRIVPAGATTLTGNRVIVGVDCESA